MIHPSFVFLREDGSGNDLTVGGTVKTWAELPYIDVGAGTNQSGAMVVHRPS